MSDYNQIVSLLKQARKRAKRLKHNPAEVERLRAEIDSLRTSNRKKLLKKVKKLYSHFDVKYADIEIDDYMAVLKIANAYCRDERDRKMIAMDQDYLMKFKKNIDNLGTSYIKLEKRLLNAPLDQENIDMDINAMFHYIDWVEAYRFERMRAEIITRIDAAEGLKARYSLRQKAVMLAACVILGIGAVTADFNAAGRFGGFGGGSAYAGEVVSEVEQHEGDFETREELMEALKGWKLLKVKNVNLFKNVEGTETLLKGYQKGKNYIFTYEINEKIYSYEYFKGRTKIIKKQDWSSDGDFEKVGLNDVIKIGLEYYIK